MARLIDLYTSCAGYAPSYMDIKRILLRQKRNLKKFQNYRIRKTELTIFLKLRCWRAVIPCGPSCAQKALWVLREIWVLRAFLGWQKETQSWETNRRRITL